MRIAILGDGLLGRTLETEIAMYVGHGELDVLGHKDIEVIDADSCKRALDGFDVAINTVAFHRLAECEKDATMARMVNTDGARIVASVRPTVYISTDYVFSDGGPHDECLPGQGPRSAYGRSKLAGELATLESGGIVVRVSALYGRYRSHKGPTFPESVTTGFVPMRLPNDQRFSPTYADDAAGRIADIALVLGGGGSYYDGIYHAANAGSTTWHEFAENIVRSLATRARSRATTHATGCARPTALFARRACRRCGTGASR